MRYLDSIDPKTLKFPTETAEEWTFTPEIFFEIGIMKPTIIRGQDYSLPIQIGVEPYPERLNVQSSSTANPCVIVTELPHQLTTGDTVRINEHRRNTAINGTHVVTVIDGISFSVPVAGEIEGYATGHVSLLPPIDDWQFTVEVKSYAGGTTVAGVTAEIAITDATSRWVTISVAKESVDLLPSKTCTFVVTYIDSANKTNVFTIDAEVVDA
jgi:hypothetical protein